MLELDLGSFLFCFLQIFTNIPNKVRNSTTCAQEKSAVVLSCHYIVFNPQLNFTIILVFQNNALSDLYHDLSGYAKFTCFSPQLLP